MGKIYKKRDYWPCELFWAFKMSEVFLWSQLRTQKLTIIRNYMFYATRRRKSIEKVKWEAKQDWEKWNEEKLLISSIDRVSWYQQIIIILVYCTSNTEENLLSTHFMTLYGRHKILHMSGRKVPLEHICFLQETW